MKVRTERPANRQGDLFLDDRSNPIGFEQDLKSLDAKTVKKLLKDQGVCVTSEQARKFIAPKEPQATILRWVFEELAKGSGNTEEVYRLAKEKD